MNQFLQKIVGFTQSKYMRIITNGFMSVAAISIAGSIFSLLKSIPIPFYQTFLTNSGLGDILAVPVSITSDLIAVYVVLAMGYTLAKEFKENGFAAATVALGAFMLVTPFVGVSRSMDPETGEIITQTMENVIPVSAVGAQGIFLAILVGLLASRLYVFFLKKGWKIKMPDSVPDSVAKMFEMMIPGGMVFILFLAVRWLFSLTSFGTAQTFIYSLLQQPLMAVAGGTLGCVVYVTVAKFLWVFGVHGGMVTYAAMATIIRAATSANGSAFAAGEAAPYPEWQWAMLIMDFSVLALSLVMVATAQSKQYKTLGKICLPTSLFNISEPQIFGIPIIMNPIMAIPFVLLQPVNMLLTILVTKLGIVAQATGAGINTQLPTPIQAAFINSHWSGAVWAVVLLALNCVIWYPFFKYMDKKTLTEEEQA